LRDVIFYFFTKTTTCSMYTTTNTSFTIKVKNKSQVWVGSSFYWMSKFTIFRRKIDIRCIRTIVRPSVCTSKSPITERDRDKRTTDSCSEPKVSVRNGAGILNFRPEVVRKSTWKIKLLVEKNKWNILNKHQKPF